MSEQQLKMTVDEIVNRVTDVLNEIINVEGGGTKIRYGESGEKFYLTRITGGESSINTLVQLIMYNEGIFKWILHVSKIKYRIKNRCSYGKFSRNY